MDAQQPSVPAPAPPPKWSKFLNDPSPDAFLIHCTQQPAMLLSVERYVLQAASSVFEDMLTVPQPHTPSRTRPYEGQNAPGVLSEVKLADVQGEDLELALRLVHRDHVGHAKAELTLRRQEDGNDLTLVRQIVRVLEVAKRYALDAVPLILFDVLRVTPEAGHTRDFLAILAVAIHHQERDLAKTMFARWSGEEAAVLDDRFHQTVIYKEFTGDPPKWWNLPFDTWAIRHYTSTKEYLIELPAAPRSDVPWPTQEREAKEVQTMWRWRPTHLSDLDDDFMDLIPVDAFRLLMGIETKVIHSSNYSWIDGGSAFLWGWEELSSYGSVDRSGHDVGAMSPSSSLRHPSSPSKAECVATRALSIRTSWAVLHPSGVFVVPSVVVGPPPVCPCSS